MSTTRYATEMRQSTGNVPCPECRGEAAWRPFCNVCEGRATVPARTTFDSSVDWFRIRRNDGLTGPWAMKSVSAAWKAYRRQRREQDRDTTGMPPIGTPVRFCLCYEARKARGPWGWWEILTADPGRCPHCRKPSFDTSLCLERSTRRAPKLDPEQAENRDLLADWAKQAPVLLDPRKKRLWGGDHFIRPALCRRTLGSANLLLAVTPIAHRPDFYLIWVDRRWIDQTGAFRPSHRDRTHDIMEAIAEDWGERPDDESPHRWPQADFSDGAGWWIAGPEDILTPRAFGRWMKSKRGKDRAK